MRSVMEAAVGVFENATDAKLAVDELSSHGVARSDILVLGHRGMTEAMEGATIVTGEGVKPGAILVVVKASHQHARKAYDVMREHRAADAGVEVSAQSSPRPRGNTRGNTAVRRAKHAASTSRQSVSNKRQSLLERVDQITRVDQADMTNIMRSEPPEFAMSEPDDSPIRTHIREMGLNRAEPD